MIALVLAAALAEAAIVPAFSPPLATELHYTFAERKPDEGGDTAVRMEYRMRLDRAGDGALVATQVQTGLAIDAPSATRPALEALYRPFVDVPLRVVLDAAGQPLAVIDGPRTWAAIRSAYAAMRVEVMAQPELSPEAKAALILQLARPAEPSAAARDESLRAAAAVFLPPPLPPLRPSERRALATSVGGPRGPLSASGSVTLEAADGRRLRYRIAIASAADAGDAAAAALRAEIGADASRDARARAEALESALSGARIEQEIEIEVERSTGLLVRSHSTQSMRRAGEPPRLIVERTVALAE